MSIERSLPSLDAGENQRRAPDTTESDDPSTDHDLGSVHEATKLELAEELEAQGARIFSDICRAFAQIASDAKLANKLTTQERQLLSHKRDESSWFKELTPVREAIRESLYNIYGIPNNYRS